MTRKFWLVLFALMALVNMSGCMAEFGPIGSTTPRPDVHAKARNWQDQIAKRGQVQTGAQSVPGTATPTQPAMPAAVTTMPGAIPNNYAWVNQPLDRCPDYKLVAIRNQRPIFYVVAIDDVPLRMLDSDSMIPAIPPGHVVYICISPGLHSISGKGYGVTPMLDGSIKLDSKPMEGFNIGAWDFSSNGPMMRFYIDKYMLHKT